MISTVEELRRASADLRRAVEQSAANLETNLGQMSEFLRYRSAKHRFFPHHAADDRAFYLDAQYNILLSAQLEAEVERGLLLSRATVEGDLDFVAQRGQQPFIFCTFHFGSFQMVGALLRQLGFDFAVLTLREGITADMLHAGGADEGLQVLHADSPSVLPEMHQALQAGKSIMAFIDGNPEAIGEADRDAYARVNLLGHTLLAKKGLPALSYATGAPIVPIVSYRPEPEQVRVAFGAPIRPDRSQPRAAFVQQALQACYGQLEQYLLSRPEQWLYWRMIHNYLDLSVETAAPETAAAPTHYTFNQQRYELYEGQQLSFLYDRRTQQAFRISPNLLGYLRHLSQRPEPVAAAERINASLREELLTKQILHGLTLAPQP